MFADWKSRVKTLAALKIVRVERRKTAVFCLNVSFKYNSFCFYYAKQLSYEVWQIAFISNCFSSLKIWTHFHALHFHQYNKRGFHNVIVGIIKHFKCTQAAFQKELLNPVVLESFGATYADHNIQQSASVLKRRSRKL